MPTGTFVGTRTYTTAFPTATENPISQGGIWTNGATTGVDWKDIQTTPGLAFGPVNFGSSKYDDATAVLKGVWTANQKVEAVVKSVNQVNGTTDFQEVEVRLRTTIAANVLKGYEVLWSCFHNGNQYHQIGYWYGPIGVAGGCALGCAFDAATGSIDMRVGNNAVDTVAANAAWGISGFGGVYDGDTVGAQIVGNRITTWIIHNGIKVILQDFNDTGGISGAAKFTSGAPGIGHWHHSTSGAVSDFGFTSITVSEA